MLTKFTQQRVRPVLVDLTVAGYEGPMASLNFTRVSEKDDVRKLLHDINKECSPPLSPHILDRAFDAAWPEFEKGVATAIKIDTGAAKPPERELGDKVDEILELMRETRVRNAELAAITHHLLASQQDREIRSDVSEAKRRSLIREAQSRARREHDFVDLDEFRGMGGDANLPMALDFKAMGGPFVEIAGTVVGEALDIRENKTGVPTLKYRDLRTAEETFVSLEGVRFTDTPF